MSKWVGNWFSNFIPFDTPYIYQNIRFKSPEIFYQAMKTYKSNIPIRKYIALLSPGRAKIFWRNRNNKEKYFRKDWININLDVMEFILKVKFAKGTTWYEKLMKEEGIIVETNNWHDNFYGECVCDKCKNKMKYNHLGRMLMEIREDYKKDETSISKYSVL